MKITIDKIKVEAPQTFRFGGKDWDLDEVGPYGCTYASKAPSLVKTALMVSMGVHWDAYFGVQERDLVSFHEIEEGSTFASLIDESGLDEGPFVKAKDALKAESCRLYLEFCENLNKEETENMESEFRTWAD